MPRPAIAAIGCYLLLVAASHAVREPRSYPPAHGDSESRIQVARVGGVGQLVELAYQDFKTGVPTGSVPPTILLVHGSPGSGHDLDALGRALSHRFRVLAPDLPGFGHSTIDLPDYSFDAHARYALALLDALRVRKAHLVGFSMGGGVVLRLADIAPDRVKSLTLASAIGVQEMELFGDYRLNHLVHGAQAGLIWFLSEATPQFGALDDIRALSYARNFYDSDQRPLRAALTRVTVPTEIVHGSRDPLVPVQAAQEHARLVPQSELTILDTDHFFAMRESTRLAAIVEAFIDCVERGEGRIRAQADPARTARAAAPFDPSTIPPLGAVARVLVLALLPFATLISEDLACVGAGMLVALGRLDFLSATLSCALGIVLGDIGLFVVGRLTRTPSINRLPMVARCAARASARTSDWVGRRGTTAILVSRFLPGARLPTYVAAGALGMPTWVFVRALVIAAALWTPLLVGVAAMLTRWGLSRGQLAPATGAVAVCAAMIVPLQALRSASTHRGRRSLVSLWRRLSRWEFWPPWVFYPPIAMWIVFLMVRYRSATVFTAVNPGIPGGGFVGESKSEILRALAQGGANVAPFIVLDARLPAFAKRAAVEAFLSAHGMPIVVKPDRGQRGSGVEIVRDRQQLDARVEREGETTILQAFVPGVEFGVFYARRRDEEAGRIISVTEKVFPSVMGDGRRTLDELIVDDPRAVAIADTYRRSCRGDLTRVVPAGERVDLCEIGSHCRGAIFLDGVRLLTPALSDAIERAARAMPGFSFGRFDVRSPSVDAFTAGELEILELNGVTSEPTHIYDPFHGLFYAYRTVAAAWSLAFEIGHSNARAGARVWSLRDLVGMAHSMSDDPAARPRSGRIDTAAQP